jgi:Flp pilus assembly protein protease CpaA
MGTILLIISINDFLFFRIENEYILALLTLYAISCVAGISGDNFLNVLAIAVITFVITAILNHYNAIGGGDVKMLFPMILLCENNLAGFFFGMGIGGAFLAMMYVMFGKAIFFFRKKAINLLWFFRKKQNQSRLLNIILLSLDRIDKKVVVLGKYVTDIMKQEIPYGIAISCGGFYVIIEKLCS